MLIINNYDNHIIYKFFNYIIEYKICLVTFSAHLTYITQFLNVKIFQLYKY